jgi:hypothetical protein
MRTTYLFMENIMALELWEMFYKFVLLPFNTPPQCKLLCRLVLQTMLSASQNFLNFTLFRPFVRMSAICSFVFVGTISIFPSRTFFSYAVVMNFYMFGPCMENWIFCNKLSHKILTWLFVGWGRSSINCLNQVLSYAAIATNRYSPSF